MANAGFERVQESINLYKIQPLNSMEFQSKLTKSVTSEMLHADINNRKFSICMFLFFHNR